ncbi:LacI family DNA-binding transcriptional regulator [Paenibacillus hexagrammi]|uniref:substrate-binding domain-containing protein n=1 Tax=Paenibacillus hexagrammi TaxID=2908839 RepID=UPI0021A5DA8F|nr:substrate-binding domain-containing protein [Paenibacillus sp. YPD9-1]
MKSQTQPYRIAVFTPHIDGEYFGKILSTISVEAQTRGSQLTIIQTQINHPHDEPNEHPVFIDQCDACIVILDGIGSSTAQLIAQTGKPVVSIGHVQPDIDCHSILIDNTGGMKEAVLHLIDHGHREIVFVAFTHQQDQMERFQAYKEALAERGIPYNPKLVCYVSDNLQGEERRPYLCSWRVVFTLPLSQPVQTVMPSDSYPPGMNIMQELAENWRS